MENEFNIFFSFFSYNDIIIVIMIKSNVNILIILILCWFD